MPNHSTIPGAHVFDQQPVIIDGEEFVGFGREGTLPLSLDAVAQLGHEPYLVLPPKWKHLYVLSAVPCLSFESFEILTIRWAF